MINKVKLVSVEFLDSCHSVNLPKTHILYIQIAFIIGTESSDPHMLESMISHGYKIAVFPKPAFVVTGTKLKCIK